MKIINGGFARALNKLADGTLGDDYLFEIPLESVSRFIPLARNALAGEYIVSTTGETYDWLTGTDVTTSLSSGVSSNDCVLFPSHPHTLGFFITHLSGI